MRLRLIAAIAPLFAAAVAMPAHGAAPFPLGVNLAGCELNSDAMPGIEDKNYSCPSHALIDFAVKSGVKLVRLPIRAQRIQPEIGGRLSTHATTVVDRIDYALAKGLIVVIDWHDYGIRDGVRIGTAPWTAAAFVAMNGALLGKYRHEPRLWIGLQNEPHVHSEAWWPWAQDAAQGLRRAGFKSKLIVSGSGSSGASSWSSKHNGQQSLTFSDPDFAFDIHFYLDEDSSGTHRTCKVDAWKRIHGAVAWARHNRRSIFIGEWAAGPAENCAPERKRAVKVMQIEGAGVIVGTAWWAMSDWMRYPKYPFGLTGPDKAAPSEIFEALQADIASQPGDRPRGR